MFDRKFSKSEGGVIMPNVRLGGFFVGEIWRNGRLIEAFVDHNLVVNEGLNHMLDVTFHGVTQVASWYLGVFEGNYTPVSTVTAATIASASTESIAYASATRPLYDEAAAASQTTTNTASRASFVFNAAKTIYGAFLISNSTKSGTTGTLMSASRFSSAKNVDNGDELLLTYAFTASSS